MSAERLRETEQLTGSILAKLAACESLSEVERGHVAFSLGATLLEVKRRIEALEREHGVQRVSDPKLLELEQRMRDLEQRVGNLAGQVYGSGR